MRVTVLLFAMLWSSAQAQIFKCEKDGRTIFQGAPCESGSRASRLRGSDSVSGVASPWDGLAYGMAPEEVQRRIQGTQRGTGSSLVTGARELLTKGNLQVSGLLFEAKYYFLEGRLTQVNLGDFSGATGNDVTLRNFERLMADLRTRFGKEEKNTVKKEYWGISASASWQIVADQLWVSIVPLTGETSTLMYGYKFGR